MNSKKVLLVVLTLIVAGVIAVLGLNLMAGEKKITQHVEHRYDVANPQFARTMGALLGPPLVAGNRVETLLNGDQIFPAMLAAIRGARSMTGSVSVAEARGRGRVGISVSRPPAPIIMMSRRVTGTLAAIR